jgi:hypothetical protein
MNQANIHQDAQTPPTDDEPMVRGDLLSAAIFFSLGLVIVYLSWTMPRLEMRGVHPATVPGLVPGLLGLALSLCGLIMGLQSFAKLRRRPGWSSFFKSLVNHETGRVSVAAGLGLIYALILVGLVPFWLATGLFVFAFILAFEVWLTDAPKPLVKAMLWAAVQAIVVAATVTLVFERGFLVRLP